MKRFLIWLVPLIALGFCILLRISDPGPIEGVRLRVYDELQRIFPARWEDTDPRVRVVDIDERSLAAIGQWPWPRTTVAALVDRLTEGGALAVAFDAVFSEPDRTSPSQVLQVWGNLPEISRAAGALPDHDAVLAQSLARARGVLGVPLMHAETPGARVPIIRAGFAIAGDDPRALFPSFHTAVANLPGLEASAAGQGSFTVEFERDGVVRRIPLVMALERPNAPAVLVPALAVEALRVAMNGRGYVIRASGASGQTAFGERGMNALRITPPAAGPGEQQLDPFDIPTDRYGRIWLHDVGPVPQRAIPAWRILAGEVPPEEIEGRIFFIGTSAEGLRDLRATPLNAAGAGVDIHARIAEQIISGDYLEEPDWMAAAELGWLLVFGLAIILLLPRTGPIVAAIVAVVGVASPFAFSAGAMVKLGWLVDPVYPAATVLLIYLLQSLLIFSAREAERRYVRGAFSRYLSPAVVETLAQHPELLKLGGEMRELSIMFCDIRGFTTRSEKMQAQELTQFLNRFLTPMTECILAEGGTIDKYMGDAIMAFWNAPLDEPDHPARIARAALAMSARLAELNRAWAAEAAAAGQEYETLAIGIGINLGMACVGNMGSDQRFDYSIIGDAVNTASRLEGLSKNYGVPIIVGEDLAARLAGFALVPLDIAKVRGKERLVRIFTLLGSASAVGDPAIAALVRAHSAILAALEDGDSDAAAQALADARAVGDPRFTVTHALYEDRIRALDLGEIRHGVAALGH
jgi:adenylate cyclase